MTLTETGAGRVLEVQATGKLTHHDYQQLVPAFDRLVQQHGKISLLWDMVEFHGWNAGALWDDLKLGARHFADVQRLALVGDQAWEHGLAQFCRPFTTAQVRYFERAQLDAARAWVAEG